MLQGAANGYALVFLSVLIGVWLLWFVVAAKRWRDLVLIGVTTIVAVLPLAPILLRYIHAHQYYGMVRGIEEIKAFSADISAVLCAPPALTFWGWIRVGCRPEGELFPGVAAFVIFAAAAISVLKWGPSSAPAARPIRVAVRILYAIALAYAAIAISVWWFGPWAYDAGPLHISASTAVKPVLVSVFSALIALALPPGARLAARRASVLSFYLFATRADVAARTRSTFARHGSIDRIRRSLCMGDAASRRRRLARAGAVLDGGHSVPLGGDCAVPR